ncbi:MAG TPA: hypothetical protein VGN04_13600 [Herbaspirillum sp.]|jgi:hypothetical protein
MKANRTTSNEGDAAKQAQPVPAMPHERDTKPDANAPRPRENIRRAAQDLKQGQVDTDQHGERGIDQAVNPGNVIDTPKSPQDSGRK